LIPHLLVVFTWQLEILVTALLCTLNYTPYLHTLLWFASPMQVVSSQILSVLLLEVTQAVRKLIEK